MADQVDYVGQRLGNYRLIRQLGQGGFAEVYLGEHIHLKTQAAVEEVVMRVLQKDPRQRFEDTRAFALALEQACFNGNYRTFSNYSSTYRPSQQPAPQGNIPSIQQRQAQPQRPLSRRTVVAGIVLAAAASSGATWYLLSQKSSSSTSTTSQGPGSTTIPGGSGSPIASGSTATPSSSALVTYQGHSDYIWSVDWSPDGTYVVSGSSDGTAQVWESDSGHTLLTYTKHTGGLVNAVAWSHHGSYIASGGNDVNTHIWEVQSGNLLHTYNTFPIFGVAWAPDDSRIVTGGYKKIAQIWRAK